MAITYIGGSSAEAATTSLPVGAQVNDVALVLAENNTNTAVPLLSGWTSLEAANVGGGEPYGYRVAWKYLTAADISAGNVGTWTAERVIVGVYRGARRPLYQISRTGTDAWLGTSTVSSIGAGSWVAALGFHRAATNAKSVTPVAGYTLRSAAFTSGKLALWDATTAVTGDLVAVNASGYRYMLAVELRAAPSAPGTSTYYPETNAFWQQADNTDAAYALTGADGGTVYRYVPSGGLPKVWHFVPPLALVGPGLLKIRSWSKDGTPAVSGAADVQIDGVTVVTIPAGTAPSVLRTTDVVIPAGVHLVQINLIQGVENRWFWDGGEYGPLPVPVAGFTASPTSGDAPLSVAFTNTSTGLGTLSYLWDFGDGNTSTAANPTHIYATEGVRTVTLTATNEGGSDQETGTITVTGGDYTAKPIPEWDRSLNAPAQFGTTVAEVVAYYQGAAEDDASAAFSLYGRAVDCFLARWDGNGRLFFHAAVTLLPSLATDGFATAELKARYGLPS